MGKITTQDIAVKLIAQNGLSKKEATLFVNMMFETIRDIVERDKSVKVKGLGTFKIIDVDSRESVNVNTGERVLIEGHNKITFTPDALMKELVNKPFSQFETVVLNDGVDFKDDEKEEDPKAEISDADEGDTEMGEMPLVDFVSEGETEDVKDEDIPERVIEPYVKSVTEKAKEAEVPLKQEASPKPDAPVKQEVVTETPVKQEVTPEPESPVKQEAATESEPASKPEVLNPESQAASEAPVEENPDVEAFADIDGEEEPFYKRWQWPLACVLALCLGYLLGNYFPFQGQKETKEAVVSQEKKVAPEKPLTKPQEAIADSVKDNAESEKPAEVGESEVDAPEENVKPEAQEEPKAPAQAAPQKQPEVKTPTEEKTPAATKVPAEVKTPKETKTPETKVPESKAPEVKLDKYELKDTRVKNGAYRIIGTDHVEKVREGDNLQRICKRTIGPGMECYIEVYNNINANTQLKKGMEIKIPKLEWKKKKNAKK